MKTYIYTETDSNERCCNKCITVYRVKNNQPRLLGNANCNTASWKGAHGQAVSIINDVDGISFAKKEDGSLDRYRLQNELTPASMYDDKGHARNAVRLFAI